ncbi:TolC family protein [Flavobacterium sp. MK4S-17]|uniref:TolC family protein n=1 Tax=Flavobacterium sp. MK4S-17 TaxID=2543737 RepID=UPI00135A99C8|nr:TolC family protein [Flavobacterium sp. MK4S-17]
MRSKPVALLLFVYLSLFAVQLQAQQKKWTLRECVEYAMQNNISVRQSELDLQLSEISKKDAWGAFLPSANANITHGWSMGLSPNPITNVNQEQNTRFTNAGISARIDLFKGLQNLAQLRRSRMAVLASQYQLQKIREDVSLNVANAFLQILFNKENLKVQQEQLQIDTKQFNRTQQLVDGGMVPKGDLLDIEATVAADNQRVVAAENQLLISKLSLAQLLQLEDFANFDIADEEYEAELSEVMAETPKSVYDKARTLRTEIKLAEANRDVAEQDVKVARGAYQPTLSGFYNLDSRVTSLLPYPFWDQLWDYKGHTLGFQLSIPILNGLSTRNNVQRSKVAFERSKLALEQQELDLERNVYTAYTDVQGAQKAYDAAVSASEARKQALTYAQARYEEGLINVFDLNQAQTLAVNAQSEVLRTKYDLIFRIKILEFYFGIPIIEKP